MTRALELIASRCPSWANITPTVGGLAIDATLKMESGKRYRVVHLLASYNGRASVKERGPAKWPTCCPERHIEPGGTFCLGKGPVLTLRCEEDADTWWAWLNEFLCSQFYVDRNRHWPSGRALHHGDAADAQLKMEEIAFGTKFESDVRDCLEYRVGWLAGELPRLSVDGTQLANLRAPCPRGCGKLNGKTIRQIYRKFHPTLRRKCRELNKITKLINLESERRQKEKEFWEKLSGTHCCQSVDTCPILRR